MNKEKKIALKGLTLSELEEYFLSINQPKFRAHQVFNWMYNHLSFDFADMRNISKELRNNLAETCFLQTLNLVNTQNSASTETKKYLFETHDGKKIESVLIPEKDRNTLCISTQVGCPLDCKFCATGLMGYKRNLSVGEVVDQYLLTAKGAGKEKITNIVYMGMGEPFLNFETTLKSIEIFTHELTKGLSRTRITVSTAGIPNKIKELMESPFRVKLAFSLHSPFEEVRNRIMPINKKYSLHENLTVLKTYAQKTRTRITFEYTMLKDLNDRDIDVKELTRICSKLPCKINLIPFNSIKHMSPAGISAELEPTPINSIYKFADKLRNNNITVMIRETQGDDIAAACGQLASVFA
ncbi:MAG: Ribosomal RNA large subunit methyltransferase N [Ignavibacteria bacterium]|nr:MAG: Ribosomal RNA large subunit methyltransferase N [Ignavibacteria bacterium]KAF0159144.1 MAG: Ribosomal RNA large subunit methyltransferase N [Ignavibacteria bacterium]